MTIEKLEAVMNSPLRIFTPEEIDTEKRDLSHLLVSPNLLNLWVDGAGHLHRKVDIVNFKTAVLAFVDFLCRLISGVSLDEGDKAKFLICKAREILDQYVPAFLAQEGPFNSVDPEKVVRFQKLYTELDELEAKFPTAKGPVLIERKEQIARELNVGLVECHFDQIMKMSNITTERFEGLSAAKKFLLITPEALDSSLMTKDHVKMIARLIDSLPSIALDETVGLHAARHLCVMQKRTTDQSLGSMIQLVQEKLITGDLIEAAKEFKVIPHALNQDPLKLSMLLMRLYNGEPNENLEFAKVVARRLEVLDGGQEHIDRLVKQLSGDLRDPNFQFQRILFLEAVLPNAERLKTTLVQLQLLAISGSLSATCVQQLLSRGEIIPQLYENLHKAEELSPQERMKIFNELIPGALNLYAKTKDEGISIFIDEAVMKLFENGSTPEAEAVMSNAMAAAITEEDATSAEKILSAVLNVNAAEEIKGLPEFFSKVFRTFVQTKQGLEIVQQAIQAQIKMLAMNELAMTALTLLKMEIGMNLESNPELMSLATQISTALTERAKEIAKEGLDVKFKNKLDELLAFGTGIDDLEKLVKDKINKLGRHLKTADTRYTAKSYLGVFHAAIVRKLKEKPNHLLSDIQEMIEMALDAAKLTKSSVTLNKPCVTKTALMDLSIRVTSQELNKYLYDENGKVKQEPFRRPA